MGSSLHMRAPQGFTLIELLVAVAILGILSAVAIPAYLHYMKKAKMVEAQTALREVEKLEAVYYIETNTYSDDLATLGFSPFPSLQYYTITINVKEGKEGSKEYEATAAANLDSDGDLDAWVLKVKKDAETELKHGCIPNGTGKVKYNNCAA